MVEEQIKIGREVVKLTPLAGVGMTPFFGIMMSDWVIILTIIYATCQIFMIMPKVYRQSRSWLKTTERFIVKVAGRK